MIAMCFQIGGILRGQIHNMLARYPHSHTECPYSALVVSRTKTTTLEVYLHFLQFKSPIDCRLISFIFLLKTNSRKVMPAPIVYADLL